MSGIQVITNTDSKDVKQAPVASEQSKESVVSDKSASAQSESQEQDESVSEESDTSDAGDLENESGQEEEEGSKNEEQSKRKNGFKRRVDKLNKKIAEERREKEYWKQEALKSQSKPQEKEQTQAQAQVKESKAPGEPNPDDFDSHTEYVKALAKWTLVQERSEQDRLARETKVKNDYQTQYQDHHKRVEEFKKSHSDWDEVTEEINSLQLSQTVHDLIVGSDNGPELLYEFAKEPEELQRICKLNPLAAAREFGKFELKIAKAPKEEKKEVKKTQAPAPITPVGSKSGSVKKSIFDKDLSQQEYEELRREQMRRKRA